MARQPFVIWAQSLVPLPMKCYTFLAKPDFFLSYVTFLVSTAKFLALTDTYQTNLVTLNAVTNLLQVL